MVATKKIITKSVAEAIEKAIELIKIYNHVMVIPQGIMQHQKLGLISDTVLVKAWNYNRKTLRNLRGDSNEDCFSESQHSDLCR